MSGTVHYRFKSSLDYDTVAFNGLHISLGDLKKAIINQKKLGCSAQFELHVTNAQNHAVYKADSELIPKNTSVVVSRIPVPGAPKPGKGWEAYKMEQMPMKGYVQHSNPVACEDLSMTADLVNADASEEEKIRAMMIQSNRGFERHNYRMTRPTGKPPNSYICKACLKPGDHFIYDCPQKNSNFLENSAVNASRGVKRSTGIPQSFLTEVDSPEQPGALVSGKGAYVVPKIDAEAYKQGKVERVPFAPTPAAQRASGKASGDIPTELQCGLCHDLMVDATVTSCCGNSFCDECIRDALLDQETDEFECPSCHEETNPDRLIPNKYLRTAIMNFLNETGYTKAKVMSQQHHTPPQPAAQQPPVYTRPTGAINGPSSTPSSVSSPRDPPTPRADSPFKDSSPIRFDSPEPEKKDTKEQPFQSVRTVINPLRSSTRDDSPSAWDAPTAPLSHHDRPRHEYPPAAMPRHAYPRMEYPRHEYPRHGHPRHDFPRHDFPRHDFPRHDFPRHDFPRHDFPRHDFPRHDFPRLDFPRPPFRPRIEEAPHLRHPMPLYPPTNVIRLPPPSQFNAATGQPLVIPPRPPTTHLPLLPTPTIPPTVRPPPQLPAPVVIVPPPAVVLPQNTADTQDKPLSEEEFYRIKFKMQETRTDTKHDFDPMDQFARELMEYHRDQKRRNIAKKESTQSLRSKSRSRSISPKRSRSKSPAPRPVVRSRTKSPGARPKRSRTKSPTKWKKRSRTKSPLDRQLKKTRSKSPMARQRALTPLRPRSPHSRSPIARRGSKSPAKTARSPSAPYKYSQQSPLRRNWSRSPPPLASTARKYSASPPPQKLHGKSPPRSVSPRSRSRTPIKARKRSSRSPYRSPRSTSPRPKYRSRSRSPYDARNTSPPRPKRFNSPLKLDRRSPGRDRRPPPNYSHPYDFFQFNTRPGNNYRPGFMPRFGVVPPTMPVPQFPLRPPLRPPLPALNPPGMPPFIPMLPRGPWPPPPMGVPTTDIMPAKFLTGLMHTDRPPHDHKARDSYRSDEPSRYSPQYRNPAHYDKPQDSKDKYRDSGDARRADSGSRYAEQDEKYRGDGGEKHAGDKYRGADNRVFEMRRGSYDESRQGDKDKDKGRGKQADKIETYGKDKGKSELQVKNDVRDKDKVKSELHEKKDKGKGEQREKSSRENIRSDQHEKYRDQRSKGVEVKAKSMNVEKNKTVERKDKERSTKVEKTKKKIVQDKKEVKENKKSEPKSDKAIKKSKDVRSKREKHKKKIKVSADKKSDTNEDKNRSKDKEGGKVVKEQGVKTVDKVVEPGNVDNNDLESISSVEMSLMEDNVEEPMKAAEEQVKPSPSVKVASEDPNAPIFGDVDNSTQNTPLKKLTAEKRRKVSPYLITLVGADNADVDEKILLTGGTTYAESKSVNQSLVAGNSDKPTVKATSSSQPADDHPQVNVTNVKADSTTSSSNARPTSPAIATTSPVVPHTSSSIQALPSIVTTATSSVVKSPPVLKPLNLNPELTPRAIIPDERAVVSPQKKEKRGPSAVEKALMQTTQVVRAVGLEGDLHLDKRRLLDSSEAGRDDTVRGATEGKVDATVALQVDNIARVSDEVSTVVVGSTEVPAYVTEVRDVEGDVGGDVASERGTEAKACENVGDAVRVKGTVEEVEATLDDATAVGGNADVNLKGLGIKNVTGKVNHGAGVKPLEPKTEKEQRDSAVVVKRDPNELYLDVPAPSKWERDEDVSDLPVHVNVATEKVEKKTLPKSVIESAEKAITHKVHKPIASTVVKTTNIPKSTSSTKRSVSPGKSIFSKSAQSATSLPQKSTGTVKSASTVKPAVTSSKTGTASKSKSTSSDAKTSSAKVTVNSAVSPSKVANPRLSTKPAFDRNRLGFKMNRYDDSDVSPDSDDDRRIVRDSSGRVVVKDQERTARGEKDRHRRNDEKIIKTGDRRNRSPNRKSDKTTHDRRIVTERKPDKKSVQTARTRSKSPTSKKTSAKSTERKESKKVSEQKVEESIRGVKRRVEVKSQSPSRKTAKKEGGNDEKKRVETKQKVERTVSLIEESNFVPDYNDNSTMSDSDDTPHKLRITKTVSKDQVSSSSDDDKKSKHAKLEGREKSKHKKAKHKKHKKHKHKLKKKKHKKSDADSSS